MGLEFWSRQKKNESIQHVQELQGVKARLQDAENQAHKLSKVSRDPFADCFRERIPRILGID